MDIACPAARSSFVQSSEPRLSSRELLAYPAVSSSLVQRSVVRLTQGETLERILLEEAQQAALQLQHFQGTLQFPVNHINFLYLYCLSKDINRHDLAQPFVRHARQLLRIKPEYRKTILGPYIPESWSPTAMSGLLAARTRPT
jgi:hypothetical protein